MDKTLNLKRGTKIVFRDYGNDEIEPGNPQQEADDGRIPKESGRREARPGREA